jgi:hypothetical protein
MGRIDESGSGSEDATARTYRRAAGVAAIIGAMAVLTRACAPLVVLGLLVACGTEQPPSSPTGSWTTTIIAADDPPSARLVDDYRLELSADGRYVLTGAGFTATGRYVLDGGTVELRDDDRCTPGTVGRYEWTGTDAGGLELTAVGTDPCDQPLGGRQFVLTRHPWAPSDDDG